MKKKHGQCDFDLRLGKSNIVKRKENLFLGFLSLVFALFPSLFTMPANLTGIVSFLKGGKSASKNAQL